MMTLKMVIVEILPVPRAQEKGNVAMRLRAQIVEYALYVMVLETVMYMIVLKMVIVDFVKSALL